MKSIKLVVAIALAVLVAVFATTVFAAPLPNGSRLYLDYGQGSAANSPCFAGSCFGMEAAPGFIIWTDVAPGLDGGVVLGKDQQPGSTGGGSLEMGELSDVWYFFNNDGTFATAPFCGNQVGCVTTGASANVFDNMSCYDAASCLGRTTLGSWHVSWNGVAVPMGSALGCLSVNPASCVGVSLWTLDPEPAATGSAFELNYAWAVPDGDPSGFGNVPFFLILRGTAEVLEVDCSSARCNDNNPCTTDLLVDCGVTPGYCTHTNAPNGTACDDGNCYTTGDKCMSGVCIGAPIVCLDDGNPCTVDSYNCNTGACRYTPISGPCNDNNACTVNDACASGVCKGTAKNCSDNNVCTTDTCDPASGICSHTGGCEPSCINPLSAGTTLGIAQGVGSGMNIPCTSGSCFGMEVSPGVVSWTDFGPGTDGGIVVGKSQASGGQETGPSATSNTPGELSNAWTFFSGYGTFFTMPDGGTKNIYCGTSCTGGDCIGKTELKVFNVAWNGSIIPMGSAGGCTHANCSTDQKDGIFVNNWTIDPVSGGAWSMLYSQVVPSGSFTGVRFSLIMRGTEELPGDLCANVACPAVMVCNSPLVCDPGTGMCVPQNPNCDDGNACTVDSCDPATGQCGHAAIPGCCTSDTQCDDGDPCTTDACVNNACLQTAVAGCGQPGTPLSTGTKLGIGQGIGSGMNIPCTTGSCFGMEVSPGIVQWTDFGPGTDGGFVVGKDQADGELSNTWSFFAANGTFNTTPGGSTNLFDSAPCSGANCINKTELKALNVFWNGSTIPMGSAGGCTHANCSADQQAGIFVSDYQVDPVNGGAWCITYSQVVPNGPFTGVRFFLRVCGTVTVDPCAGVNCDDNNACTNDTCNPATGSCVHNPIGCINEDPCTVAFCDPSKGCVYMPDRCNDGNACTRDTCDWLGGCFHTPIVCNDNNACTTDSCNTATGCVYTPIPNCGGEECGECLSDYECPTGMKCNANTLCLPPCDCPMCTVCSGYCVVANCNDNNACTTDTYSPATGCVHTPVNCDDNNVCTDDTCNPATGCGHGNNTASCNDNDACTVNDVCSNGSCVPGAVMNCDDNNTCTTDACVAGVCQNPALPDGTSCTTGTLSGACQAAVCVPYPACPKGAVKSVTLKGGKDGKADNQIMTEFTVMNGGCIVRSSASKVVVTPGTVLLVNFKKGIGPQPTSGTWQDAPISTDNNLIIPCPSATGDVGHLILDNHSALGGKDGDDMVVNVSAN